MGKCRLSPMAMSMNISRPNEASQKKEVMFNPSRWILAMWTSTSRKVTLTAKKRSLNEMLVLFKVKINVIMMMSVMSFVFLVLSFVLFFCSWVHVVRAAFFLADVLLLRRVECRFVDALDFGHVCVVLITCDFTFVDRIVKRCVLRLHLEALAAP